MFLFHSRYLCNMFKRPPFKLEALRYEPKDYRAETTLYCKKEYRPGVKVTDWHLYLEHQPIDTNPYDPDCFRLHNSYYKRLGSQDVIHPISETHDTLRNGMLRWPALEQDPHKKLINFYTFKSCPYFNVCEHRSREMCPRVCAEYITTMQSSYEAPAPCKIKALVAPTVGNQNKKFTCKSDCKYLDDNFQYFTNTLQEVKGFRHVSFNPCTGMNTDGS